MGGWDIIQERYEINGGAQTTGQFAAGPGDFNTPVTGFYQVCANMRLVKRKNVDLTIRKNYATVLAHFGQGALRDFE